MLDFLPESLNPSAPRCWDEDGGSLWEERSSETGEERGGWLERRYWGPRGLFNDVCGTLSKPGGHD